LQRALASAAAGERAALPTGADASGAAQLEAELRLALGREATLRAIVEDESRKAAEYRRQLEQQRVALQVCERVRA
ncbi:MAG: hypothetical protein ACK4ZJ_17835, partial [Allorhizobium sp.]